MVGNVPSSRADNTPWSHTTVTQSPIMVKHGRQIKNYGTMIKLLQELLLLAIRYTEDCSL